MKTTLPESALRMGVRLTSQVSPNRTADAAFRRFCSPRRLPSRRWERAGLESSEELGIRGHPWALDPRPLSARVWQPRDDGARAYRGSLLLLHGWEGRAGHFAALGPALAASGWRAVALDLPAHGDSPGRMTNVHDMALAVRSAAHHFEDVRGIVAHSFGGAVATVAMGRGLQLDAAVYLASPSDLLGLLRRAALRMGLGERARGRLFSELRRVVGMPLEELQPIKLAESLATRLLMLHDPDDVEVDLAESQNYLRTWSGAQLEEVDGIGHWRILRDDETVGKAVRFMDAAID